MIVYEVTPEPRAWSATRLEEGLDRWVEMFEHMCDLGIRVALHINNFRPEEERIEIGYDSVMYTGDWFVWCGEEYKVVSQEEFESGWKLVHEQD